VSVNSAQRDVEGHQKELARLQQEKGREAARAADAIKKAASAAAAASSTRNVTSANSKLREAQRYQSEAVKYQNRVADYESRIAGEQKRLLEAHKKLNREVERMNRRHIDEQKKVASDHERQMRSISGVLGRHSRLHAHTKKAMDKLQQLPERITVLFLALDPRDQNELLLGEEARAISDMIRKSHHRDSVVLDSRWAVRPLDVLQAINESRPRVIHFSGHGSTQDELLFQDDLGDTKAVSKDAIVQLMAATTGHIQLVFFNACYSRAQAEAVVKHISAAIGMNTAIGDDAARIFSASFYSAIGFGLSVKTAFEQAKAALMLEGIPEESTPELFVANGLDPDQLFLVRAVDDDARGPAANGVPSVTSQVQSRRVDVTMALVTAGNALTSRMHHMLSISKQAVLVFRAHGYVSSVQSSLKFAFDELHRTARQFEEQIEAVKAAFPDLTEPTLQLMLFRDLAYMLGWERQWQARTLFEGATRHEDPMETRNPWDRFDWRRVFGGEDPDAGIIEGLVLEFSRRLDSFASHVFAGHEPVAWWPSRQREERERFAALIEARRDQLSPEKRAEFESALERFYGTADER